MWTTALQVIGGFVVFGLENSGKNEPATQSRQHVGFAVRAGSAGSDRYGPPTQQTPELCPSGVRVLGDPLVQVERDGRDLVHAWQLGGRAAGSFEAGDRGLLGADVVLQLAEGLADVRRSLATLDEVHERLHLALGLDHALAAP